MKKGIVCTGVCVIVTVGLFACSGGSSSPPVTTTTYSNSSLNGTWLFFGPSWPGKGYTKFDGNGAITDNGTFYPGTPPGTYQVQPDGSFSITLNYMNFPSDVLTGTLTSLTMATITSPLSGSGVKIANAAACQGTWTGSLTETSGGSATHAFSFIVDANGNVTSITGFASPVSGAMFCEAGNTAAFFDTAEQSWYDQFKISGTVSVNNATGTFSAIGGGVSAGKITGTFSLTKQ